MKRILWICNIMLPAIAEEIGLPYSNREGWLTGIFDALTKRRENTDIQLGVCFPCQDEEKLGRLSVRGVSCYGFYENLNTPEQYDFRMEQRFRQIFQDFKPDMIHIFGTEFPHGLAAARAFGRPERTLTGIQGLCGEIAACYQAGVPDRIFESATFRDVVRKDSLKQQKEKFVKRGEHERQLIQLSGHITGRTAFDREGTGKLNPKARYHAMNETMRSNFYIGKWEADRCEKHRIFFGQGDYPLKGLHFMLKAMPLLLPEYPDAQLYVAGNSVISHGTLKERLKLSAYGAYLLKLIKEYGLEDNITPLGKLSAEEMKRQYLQAGVFVCASVLENSPNTVGEAMLLGVPVIASETGGIPDMITHGKDGLLFAPGSEKALAEAVRQIWASGEEAKRLSEAGRKRALEAHDPETNYRRLLEIYRDILAG